MKIFGWARLGIVVSIAWAIGVIGIATYEYHYSSPRESSSLIFWENSKLKPWQDDWRKSPPQKGEAFDPDAYLRSKGMSQQEVDTLSYQPSFRWSSIALFVFGPPLFAWLLVIVFGFAISWVAAGFKENDNQ